MQKLDQADQWGQDITDGCCRNGDDEYMWWHKPITCRQSIDWINTVSNQADNILEQTSNQSRQILTGKICIADDCLLPHNMIERYPLPQYIRRNVLIFGYFSVEGGNQVSICVITAPMGCWSMSWSEIWTPFKQRAGGFSGIHWEPRTTSYSASTDDVSALKGQAG